MPVVGTSFGDLQGIEEGGVLRLAGVPYALAPTGPRRYKPPEPLEPWTGVRSAERFGAIAPQLQLPISGVFGEDAEEQDEDCLFLNVFTPAADDRARPVMVWLHGGAFVLGSGSSPLHDGTRLAQRGDVVVVTLNYRLGALGYLYLGELDSSFAESGCSGLLDQIAALEWVQDNIAQLGGDPGNVTIFGESAGGMSVGALLSSPSAEGLFHKAIAQSGAGHNVTPRDHATETAKDYLAQVGIGSVAQIVDIEPSELLAPQQEFLFRLFSGSQGDVDAWQRFLHKNGFEVPRMVLPFQPVVDGVALPETSFEAIKAGTSSHIPLLVGSTRDEWRLFDLFDFTTMDAVRLRERFARFFNDPDQAIDGYRDFAPDSDAKALCSMVATDWGFRQPAIQLAETRIDGGAPAFMYRFDWPSPVFGLGACHSLDVAYVFGTTDQQGAQVLLGPEPSQFLVEAIQDSWIAFSREGDPSNETIGEWPKYGRDRPTMLLDNSCSIESDPESVRRHLWSPPV